MNCCGYHFTEACTTPNLYGIALISTTKSEYVVSWRASEVDRWMIERSSEASESDAVKLADAHQSGPWRSHGIEVRNKETRYAFSLKQFY